MNPAVDGVPARVSGIISPGHVLGRYELLIPVAAGGMAMVWAARLKGSRGFQKIVAVKTMLPKLSEDPQFEQMFLDEASLASEVRHPHIVEILDLGEQDHVLFLVMEWIDGVPLNQLMRVAKGAGGGIPLPIAVRIAMQACAGLHSAHELRNGQGELVGLVHRDVSPQNIMVTNDGVTKVVDFGVAKATAIGGGATSSGQVKGKVGYMAPEQIEATEIDRRVDIFAMGIVLYALTTGKHPFRRESDPATMYNICSPQPVLPPRKIIPDYPEGLEKVLLRALAKQPEDRYSTANEMLRALDNALPPTEDAITDEDVARYVRELVGDKLSERRAALNEALARADENALATLRVADLTSQDSALTTGVTAADLSMLADAADWSPRARRRRLAWRTGLLVLVASLGAGVAALLSGGEEAPTTESAPSAIAAPAPPPATGPKPPTVNVESIPVEPAADSTAETPPVTPPKPVAPGPGPARPHPPKSTTGRPPSWKHDPGF